MDLQLVNELAAWQFCRKHSIKNGLPSPQNLAAMIEAGYVAQVENPETWGYKINSLRIPAIVNGEKTTIITKLLVITEVGEKAIADYKAAGNQVRRRAPVLPVR